jgi:hypothetical protein
MPQRNLHALAHHMSKTSGSVIKARPNALHGPPETGVRGWLRDNGYVDVARLISSVMGKWRMSRVATRRNWWAILAGGKGREPCVIGGRVFPVLAAAQRRQGKTVTPNAIERRPGEKAPAVSPTNRWAGRAQGGAA